MPFYIHGMPMKSRYPHSAPHYRQAIELQILTEDAPRFLRRAGKVTPLSPEEEMKRIAIIGALGCALLAISGTARARVNVDIGIGIPGVVYAEPAPVYVAPQPVYVAPQPVYVPRPVIVAPAPAYAPRWRERDYDDDNDQGERKWRRHERRGHGDHGRHGDED